MLSQITRMKLIHSRTPEVIVVGAGLAGLVCASKLQAQGMHVQVVEKSGDLGGRPATRRRPDAGRDHVRQLAGSDIAASAQ